MNSNVKRIAFVYTFLQLILSHINCAKKDGINEDAYLNGPELIRKYGYPCEIHYVTTADGYILQIHRIPYGKDDVVFRSRIKPAVIVQHGLLGASHDFVLLGPEKALGYLLADAGYDVWLPNFRGNVYSRNHTQLNPNKDAKFWNYSWHEIGIYDISAIIDYVLDVTRLKKLFHIGYSQGTTAFYVLLCERPQYNDKVIAHISLAPTAYKKYVRSPFYTVVGRYIKILQPLSKLRGFDEFYPGYRFLNNLSPAFCKSSLTYEEICAKILFTFFGNNRKELDRNLIPLIVGHDPAGVATKQIIHYGQEVNSGRFAKFDYGIEENRRRYGNDLPPDYDLSNIRVPIYIFYSLGDLVADTRDVFLLKNQLRNVKDVKLIDDPDWSHGDYIFGKSAKRNVYDQIINILKRYDL